MTSHIVNAETMHNGATIGLNSRGAVASTNDYYIYVKAGERAVVRVDVVTSSGTANNGGVVTMFAPDGSIVGTATELNADSHGLPGNPQNKPSSVTIVSPIAAKDGVYSVNITSKTGATRGYFRLSWTMGATRTDETAIIGGRVWTDTYTIAQNMLSTISDMKLYFVGEHGVIYEAHYYDYNGIDSTIYSNNIGSGVVSGCLPLYASIDRSKFAKNQPIHNQPDSCARPYKIFFDIPDATLPQTVVLPNGKNTWLNSPIVNTSITNMKFSSDRDTDHPVRGVITADVNHYIGKLLLKVDANGNGSFDDPEDREISFSNTSNNISLNFDGKDGKGSIIPEGVRVGFRIEANMKGEIHFMRSDTEISGGIFVKRINGSALKPTHLYWDDSHLVHNCGNKSVIPIKNLDGVDSTGGVHGWNYDGCVAINGTTSYGNDSGQNNMTAEQYKLAASWGNLRIIDDWTYDHGLAYASTIFYAEPTNASVPSAPNTGAQLLKSSSLFVIVILGLCGMCISSRRNS